MYEDIEREEPLPSPGARIPSVRVNNDVRDELVRRFNVDWSRKRDSLSRKHGHSTGPFNVRQHWLSTVKLLAVGLVFFSQSSKVSRTPLDQRGRRRQRRFFLVLANTRSNWPKKDKWSHLLRKSQWKLSTIQNSGPAGDIELPQVSATSNAPCP